MKKLNINLSLIILVLITILGLFLRTWMLNVSPPGFNADEAALGYNAYSLLKTGLDEWSQPFPLVFKSFSDYKPGLYVYLAMPFIAVMGLTELATRMPSILLGTLSIILIYLLSLEIFKRRIVALSTAFLLAVSPWHIHYSRGAWETNVATFFILAGVLTFVWGLKKKKWLFLSAASFIASMYTYQSPRLNIPIFLLLLAIFYFQKIFIVPPFKNFVAQFIKLNKQLWLVFLLAIVLLIPLFLIVFNHEALARFQGVSIFTDIGTEVTVNQARGEHSDPNGLMVKIYHNKLIGYGLAFTGHYLDHFTPSFLFTSGDPLSRNKVPEMGQMHLFEIATFLIGLLFLSIRKYSNVKIILLWLLTAPIAASLTYQTPHALRAESMVIPLALISGLGFGMILDLLRGTKAYFKIPGFLAFWAIVIFFILKFMHQYFVHLPVEYGLEWEAGFSQMVPYVMSQKDNYDKVIITTRYDQPYILMLFYSKYDPKQFQNHFQTTSIDNFGFSTVSGFDKFEFRKIDPKEIGSMKNVLYVGSPEELLDTNPLKQINYPNGTPAFKIVSIK